MRWSLTQIVLLHYAAVDGVLLSAKKQPILWIRYRSPMALGATRLQRSNRFPWVLSKVKQFVADRTLQEHHADHTTNAHRFDAWVPTFFAHRYRTKTRIRYGNAWSALAVYLDHACVIAPSQVNYRLCADYRNAIRTVPDKLLRPRSHNTAMELKVFSAITQSAATRLHSRRRSLHETWHS